MSLAIEENAIKMPVIALRGLVIFPEMLISFDVGRQKSAAALKYAMEHDRLIFAVTQKEIHVDDPADNDVYEVGCVLKVRQLLKLPDNAVKVFVEGLYRAEHTGLVNTGSMLVSDIVKIEDKPIKNRPVYIETLLRRVRTQFEKYAEVYTNVAGDMAMHIAESTDIGKLADYIASNVPAPYDDKQYILEQSDPIRRARILIEMLDKEREIGEIDRRINEKTKAAIDENQRDYYLREQLHVIREELGEDDDNDADSYRARIQALKLPKETEEKLLREVSRFARQQAGSAEAAVLRRGKNASKATVAKHATVQEYRASTGFECLLGWLYLQGRNDRIEELFNAMWDGYKPE